MTLEDARYILRQIAIPNYRDFVANQLSARHAFNAAVSIAHMVDHIVIRSGGKPGEVGNTRKDFAQRSPSFKHVEAMCNAIKHVYATGGGSSEPIATATGVAIAGTDVVLFTDKIDGFLKEFRPTYEILIFEFNDKGVTRKLWVGWELYGALLFVAKELKCEALVLAEGTPDQIDLRYRDAQNLPSIP